MNFKNARFINVLLGYKIEEESCAKLLHKTETITPLVSNLINGRIIINWFPNFLDYLSSIYETKDVLMYSRRYEVYAPAKSEDSL